MSLRIGHLKKSCSYSYLICVHLCSSVFICGKNLTKDNNKKFDDIIPQTNLRLEKVAIANHNAKPNRKAPKKKGISGKRIKARSDVK